MCVLRQLVSVWFLELLVFELICSPAACANVDLMKCGASWVMATVHHLSALSSLLFQAGQSKNKHSHFLFQAPASSRLPLSLIQTSQWEWGVSESWESTGWQWHHNSDVVVLNLGRRGNLCVVLEKSVLELDYKAVYWVSHTLLSAWRITLIQSGEQHSVTQQNTFNRLYFTIQRKKWMNLFLDYFTILRLVWTN